MYNETSYTLFKRLEFKNMMNRFDKDMLSANEESQITAKNIVLSNEMESIFHKISGETSLGLCLVGQDPVLGLSISMSEEQPCFIPVSETVTADLLKSRVRDILRTAGHVAVMDFKSLLYQIGGMEETGNIFDLGVAGYLLNPLRDTYHYDDIARDYLGQTLPSKSDLFGKESVDKFYQSGDEILLQLRRISILDTVQSHAGYEGPAESRKHAGSFLYDGDAPCLHTI